jgi:phosphoribosylaminoimidazole-succinocarboxamide synthase
MAATPEQPAVLRRLPMRRGKVRDVYDLELILPGHLLIVASDRVSAYDVILPTLISGKGRLLTQVAAFWFNFLKTPHHLVSLEVPSELVEAEAELAERVMVVRKLKIVPFECVARGYLAGSGWREYQQSGRVCGVELPTGLREHDRLPEPIFTPATKAEEGHDENVSFATMANVVGEKLAAQLRDKTLRLYQKASNHAAARGILIADTKLEWGHDADGQLRLADECFTPDSSRFWPADDWRPGERDQPSYDKQYVREYLATLDWDRQPPGPELPTAVVEGTRRRYAEAADRLTGSL